jgi:hypothetical protein
MLNVYVLLTKRLSKLLIKSEKKLKKLNRQYSMHYVDNILKKSMLRRRLKKKLDRLQDKRFKQLNKLKSKPKRLLN